MSQYPEEDLETQSAVWDLRETASGNQRDLDSRSYQREFSRTCQMPVFQEREDGGFYLRTALCLLLFCGFLWLKHENRSILGMAPEAVQEAVSQSVVLQYVPDSVKIEKKTP